MNFLANAWIRRVARRSGRIEDLDTQAAERRKDLVRQYAPGKSFADIGCMWNINGGFCFIAEESGATAVAGLDAMDPTEEFLAERERRGSSVRFVQGDAHDVVSMEQVGVHDVVFCAGVFYHTPHPFLLLQNLHRITADTLLIGGHTMPEVPGLSQASIFYPALEDRTRNLFARVYPGGAGGVSAPFDRTPGMGFAGWWWGLTPSALVAMLDMADFEVVDVIRTGDFITDFVAKRLDREGVVPKMEFPRLRAEARGDSG